MADDARLGGLRRAVEGRLQGAGLSRLDAWRARELGADGLPVRIHPKRWSEVLLELERAKRDPSREDLNGGASQDLGGLRHAVRALAGGEAGAGAASISVAHHYFALMRGRGANRSDSLEVEQERGVSDARIRLQLGGCTWCEPSWRTDVVGADSAPPARRKWLHWNAGAEGDVAEWSVRSNGVSIVRTAVFLPKWKLALLADQVEGAGTAEVTQEVTLAAGIRAEPVESLRVMALRGPVKGMVPRFCSLALPASPYPTERGRLEGNGTEVRAHHAGRDGRAWYPMLVSWDADRDRKGMQWRVLTVTQDRKLCGPAVAFAVRVGWPQGDSLVIYRSLTKPALRAFIGHQCRARLLIGRFTREGELKPLVQID